MFSLEVTNLGFDAAWLDGGELLASSDYWYEGMTTPQKYIRDRFMRLAVARCLQVRRSLSVESMRVDIGSMSRFATSAFAGLISNYKRAGVVVGVVAGKDGRGYPFKNWILQDGAAAKNLLAAQGISPMPIMGLSAIKNRQGGIYYLSCGCPLGMCTHQGASE